MVEVNFYEKVEDSLLEFAVIISKSKGKWVFCKHKERDTYEVPGGHREPNEPILETAKRELMEETGYGEGEWKEIMSVSGNSSTTNNISHCFVAKGVKKIGTQHLDSTEDLEVVLLDRSQVWDLMVNDQVKQALMAAPLWRFFAENQK